MAVDAPSDAGKCNKVVVYQRPEDGVDLGIAQFEAIAQCKGLGQVAPSAGGIQHEVTGDLAQLKAGKWVFGMDDAQEMQYGRVIALRVFDQDGSADTEQVCLGREVIDPFGSDNALAQFAQRHQDGG